MFEHRKPSVVFGQVQAQKQSTKVQQMTGDTWFFEAGCKQ